MSWPINRRTPSLPSLAALALSLLVHLALLFSAGVRGGQPGAGHDVAAAPAVVTVRLLAAPRQVVAAVPAPLPVPRATASSKVPVAAPVPLPVPAPGPTAAPDFTEGPAITTPAKVAEGLHGAALLVVPDVAPGKLTVRFWIDEHGAIEHVQADEQRYSDSDADKVRAALLRVRFHPARAGQLAVRSALQLDLLVTHAADL